LNGTISVIVPTYNGAPYLGEALESVMSQTLPPREVIVVDDFSTDESVAIARHAALTSPVPLTVIPLAENSGGPARPINIGVAAARGEFALVLEQDDVLLPGTLEQHMQGLTRASGAAFSFALGRWMPPAGGDVQHRPVIDELIAESEPIAAGRLVAGDRALTRILWHGNYCAGFPAVAFRRSAWEQVGGVSTRWRGTADFDFFCRLASVGSVLVFTETGYLRRPHAESLTSTMRGDTLLELFDLVREWSGRVEERGVDAEFRERVRAHLLRIGWRLRDLGRYGDSVRVHRWVWQHFGTRRDQLAAVAKVGIHWGLSRVNGVALARRARGLMARGSHAAY
jgi:glycosyltransferase involved in cell wall biosynthesis